MRTLFLKEINGRKPATLQALYVAILGAFNKYEKAKKQYGKYGLLARDNAVKAMISNTEEEEEGGNSNSKSKVQEKAKKQEQQGKNRKDYSKACAACGRNGHKAGRDSCYFVSANHPDYNTDWKTLSFEKSNKGRAWMAKGKPEIPHGLTLSGKNWEPKISFQEWRKKRAPDSEDTENPSKRQKKGNNFTTNHNCHLLDETESSPVSEAHTLHCGIITPQKKSYVNVLIDTGALQGNYLSADVAQWLQHQGVEEFKEKIKVCSFKGCETVNSYFLVDFSFLDKISGKIIIIEKIKTWLLPNCPYDIILGRKTLENFDLLGRINLSDKKYSQKFNFDLNKNETDISAQKAQSKTQCEKIRLDHKKMKDWEFCVGSAHPTS